MGRVARLFLFFFPKCRIIESTVWTDRQHLYMSLIELVLCNKPSVFPIVQASATATSLQICTAGLLAALIVQ